MKVKTLPFNEAFKTLSLPGVSKNLFSSEEWLMVLYRTYNLKLYVKYIIREDKVSSYIVYSVVKNFLEWKICICSYCDYCDTYVDCLEDWELFYEDIRREYPEYRIAVRNLRDELVRKVSGLKELSRERYHILDVRKDLDEIKRKSHDSYKCAISQAQRNGVSIRVCEKKYLKEFYNAHLAVRKYKYKIFPQPYRFFDIIWQEFMDKGKGILLGAFNPEGEFIAGNVYLICGNILYYKFNTSCLKGLKLRPNNLLFWEGIKFAKEKNIDFIDLGSSGIHQKGLIMYKNHTGADMQDIVHFGYTPESYKFSEKRILQAMTQFCTQTWMPDIVLEWGSNIIYPYLA